MGSVAPRDHACYPDDGMPRTIHYDRLPTEQRLPSSRRLDQLSIDQLLRLMHREDTRAVEAVGRQQTQIARAIRVTASALRAGGRLFLVGAGTSGRLGVIEAAECPPSFHTPPSLVQAVMAGGQAAVFRSREGAEDDRGAARRAIARRVRCGDVVIGIAASGITLFVEAALRAAAARGAATVLLTCAPGARIRADVRIALPTGPEVLTGSTRLKAGTATKLVLNMLTLGAMVQLGKTYGNLMVDVRPTSRKLRARAVRIVRELTGASEPAARRLLAAARGRVKVAVLMAKRNLTYRQALQRLATVGSLRRALDT